MNFQNPWGNFNRVDKEKILSKVGLGKKKLLNNKALNFYGTLESKAIEKEVYDYQIKWFKDIGYKLLKLNMEAGGVFTDIGIMLCISHANKENSWGQTVERAWNEHNWWNFGYLKSRGQISGWKNSHTNFAKFDSLKLAFEAYLDRVTSEPDYLEWHNPNFNPSYPALGEIYMRNVKRLPTSDELLEACRMVVKKDQLNFSQVTGKLIDFVDNFNEQNNKNMPYEIYQYCGNCGAEYGNSWLQIARSNKMIFRKGLFVVKQESYDKMVAKIEEVFHVRLNNEKEFEAWLISLGNVFGNEKFKNCKPEIDEFTFSKSMLLSYSDDALWN